MTYLPSRRGIGDGSAEPPTLIDSIANGVKKFVGALFGGGAELDQAAAALVAALQGAEKGTVNMTAVAILSSVRAEDRATVVQKAIDQGADSDSAFAVMAAAGAADSGEVITVSSTAPKAASSSMLPWIIGVAAVGAVVYTSKTRRRRARGTYRRRR